jgi:hypothetical protein
MVTRILASDFFNVDDHFVVIIVAIILHMNYRAICTGLVHTREVVHSQHRDHLLRIAHHQSHTTLSLFTKPIIQKRVVLIPPRLKRARWQNLSVHDSVVIMNQPSPPYQERNSILIT